MEELTRGIDLAPFVFPASVALIAFFVRLTVKRAYAGIISFILDVISVIFVGVMVSFLLESYELSKGTKWFIIAITAITGPDILAGILQTGIMFSRNPVTFTLRVLRIITNNPLTAKEVRDMTEWENELQGYAKKGDMRKDDDTEENEK